MRFALATFSSGKLTVMSHKRIPCADRSRLSITATNTSRESSSYLWNPSMESSDSTTSLEPRR